MPWECQKCHKDLSFNHLLLKFTTPTTEPTMGVMNPCSAPLLPNMCPFDPTSDGTQCGTQQRDTQIIHTPLVFTNREAPTAPEHQIVLQL